MKELALLDGTVIIANQLKPDKNLMKALPQETGGKKCLIK